MKELTLEATIENIPRVTAFVNDLLEANGCIPKAQRLIDVAIDELFSNIALYAYGEHTGMATVQVKIHEDPGIVYISFIDSGVPFNPLTRQDPSLNLTVKERKAGGFGISIVKRSMDDVCYAYAEGHNITKIAKTIR